MGYIKHEVINLKSHPEYNEKWVQQIISEDPSILELGDLEIKDSERTQPSGGRLDLLLYDPASSRRYEVELQLGKSDASHIIRTLEYWDYERRRFPQYEHCAVLIAEDITSRFLNVISLFNGIIPIIAIQMKAIKIKNDVSLIFSTVLDELTLGTEEEEKSIPADRNFWEKKVPKNMMTLCDKILSEIIVFAPGYQLKYNKHYIGLSKDGIAKIFMAFFPRKTSIILGIRLEQHSEIQEQLEQTDLDLLTYDRQWKQYRMRINKEDFDKQNEVILGLIERAFNEYPY